MMMNWGRRLSAACCFVAAGLIVACGDVAGIPGSSVVMLRANLNELTSAIDRAVVSVDSATANKLEMAGNEARRVLKDIEGVEQKSYEDAQKILSAAIRDTHTLSADLRRTVTSSQQQIFRELDGTLAVMSEALSELPFIDVRPYVAAIEPGRLLADSPPQSLDVFGYLPGDPGESVTASVDGKQVDVSRTRRSGITLSWPSDVQLTEGAFIPVKIQIQEEGWLFGFFGRRTEIVDRIRVARAKPLSCKIGAFTSNPEYLVEVKANTFFKDEANTQKGGGKPSVIRTVSAKDLFTSTVSDFQSYDLDTVSIKDHGGRLETHGGCGHADPRGSVTSWGPDHVSFELQAPSIGPHSHPGGWIRLPFGGRTRGLPWLHGGGGSKAIMYFTPTFMAAKRGVEPLKEVSSKTIALGGEVYEEPLAFGAGVPWSVHIACQFEDGDERWSSGPIVLNAEDSENIARGVGARIADGRLYVYAPDLVPAPKEAVQQVTLRMGGTSVMTARQ